MAESEWGQAMDVWLSLLHEYEELQKEKKAWAARKKGQRGPAIVLREGMNRTIRERRAAEQWVGSDTSAGDSPIPESSQSSEGSQPAPAITRGRRSGNRSVKAFASRRGVFDRVLDSLSASDEAMISQLREVERDKMDRWEAVERDKLDVLRQAFGTQKTTEGASSSVEVERLAVRGRALEAQIDELGEKVAQMQRTILEQGRRTEEKLDTMIAILQQSH